VPKSSEKQPWDEKPKFRSLSNIRLPTNYNSRRKAWNTRIILGF